VPGEGQATTHRLVLLGASNLTRHLAVILGTARQLWPGELDVLAALGHGRSYGLRSTVLVRSLAGIIPSGLWPALAAREPVPTAALVTDIGNDLFYGASPEQIAGWVTTCLDRLFAAEARVTMTALPVCNLDRVTPGRYGILRRLLFPNSSLTFDDAMAGVLELDQRVRRLASERTIPLIEPRAEWYGLDPIHILTRHSTGAWLEILGAHRGLPAGAPLDRVSLAQRAQMLLLVPEQRWVFGREQRGAQPCWHGSGVRLSLY
jgi:hypothetical protein